MSRVEVRRVAVADAVLEVELRGSGEGSSVRAHPNLIEPPPVHTPSRDQFIAANDKLREDYRRFGAQTTLDRFLTRAIGPGRADRPASLLRRRQPQRSLVRRGAAPPNDMGSPDPGRGGGRC